MKKKLFIPLLLCIMILAVCVPVCAATGYTNSGDFVVDDSLVEFSGKTINGNLYVKNGATYTFYGDMKVLGDVYLFGDMNNYGNITVNGTFNCLNYYSNGMVFSAGSYSNGSLNNFGKLTATNLNIRDNYLSIYVPTVPDPTPTPTPTPIETPVVTPIPTETPVQLIPASSFSVIKIPTQVYSKYGVRPGITVKYNGNTLEHFVDYTVRYENNSKPGVGKCIINGIGKYTGTKTISFYISPQKQTITYAKSLKPKQATVKFQKVTGQSGVQICYSTSSTFKSPKYTTTTATSKTVTKLPSKRTYYFKARSYKTVGSKKIYGPYSSVKKVVIK